jgi:di/tricarboxylate transporter
MLTWKIIEKHFPWTIIFLVGGSLALADGCEKSNFTKWFGAKLESVIPNNKYLALLIISIFSMTGTEV